MAKSFQFPTHAENGSGAEIRNPKHEIRKKIKIRIENVQMSDVAAYWSFAFRALSFLRISDFEILVSRESGPFST